MMKMACIQNTPKIVFDPCAGWGGRLLGAVSFDANYIAFEPNTRTFEGLNNLVDFLGIRRKVTLICDDALEMDRYDIPKVDMVLTSPPYYDLEVYADEPTQSIKGATGYEQWSEHFLRELVKNSLDKLADNGVSCWNVWKTGKYTMLSDIIKYHTEFGYSQQHVLKVISSKRQSNQNVQRNVKSSDDTVVFSKFPLP
jgi:16S rRNA G966 N2-methylase RsmD